MTKTFTTVALGIALAGPFTVHASASDAGLHVILTGGLTAGGDTIATLNYTNGSSERVKGGRLLQVGGGVLWQAATMPVAASFTVNYHVDNASASNGKAQFDRVPLETLIYYTGIEKWRFGAGLRFVDSPKATYKVDRNKETLRFRDATGAIVEAGYAVAPNAWINVRYVSEEYEARSYTAVDGQTYRLPDSIDFDGSHIGVNFLYQF